MSTIKVDNLQTTAGAGLYPAKAWVNFRGVGPTISAQGNVSSITDDGVGDFHINFTNNFVDANYAPAGWAKDSNNGGSFTIVSAKFSDTLTTSSCPILCRETTISIDPVDAGVSFVR